MLGCRRWDALMRARARLVTRCASGLQTRSRQSRNTRRDNTVGAARFWSSVSTGIRSVGRLITHGVKQR